MLRTCSLIVLMLLAGIASAEGGWKAGVARADITPREPIWMSGYAARDHASTGQLTGLWAKALALEDESGHRAVLVSLDLVGIDRETSLDIRTQLASDHGLELADIALCTSHTHSGPVVGSNLMAMYALDDEQWQRVRRYTQQVRQDVVRIAGEALNDMRAAELGWGIGHCTFAVNRRENREADVPTLREQGMLKGPVDHEAPVLSVTIDGQRRAVLFGYACHATTLSDYEWCGDWPGYAQIALEQADPPVTALFFAGCGADQNPIPRRSVELAKHYGRQMADAVTEVLGSELQSIAPTLQTRYGEIELAFDRVPTREQLQQTLSSENKYEARRARHLLEQLGDDERASLAASYPYPVQTWRLGEVTGVILGGEVVVDYSLAIKALQEDVDFVVGYANDVMAYIPSERVLAEGGYEGGGAMVYYGLPSAWASGVEQQIVDAVRAQLHSLNSGAKAP